MWKSYQSPGGGIGLHTIADVVPEAYFFDRRYHNLRGFEAEARACYLARCLRKRRSLFLCTQWLIHCRHPRIDCVCRCACDHFFPSPRKKRSFHPRTGNLSGALSSHPEQLQPFQNISTRHAVTSWNHAVHHHISSLFMQLVTWSHCRA